MPEFVIEKEMTGLGNLAPDERNRTARESCSALHDVAPGIEWLHSYLTNDKVYCVYRAPSREVLERQLTRIGSKPISICEVHSVIRPAARD